MSAPELNDVSPKIRMTEFFCLELAEMLAELSRREKEANIKPDPDIDIFMKVITTS